MSYVLLRVAGVLKDCIAFIFRIKVSFFMDSFTPKRNAVQSFEMLKTTDSTSILVPECSKIPVLLCLREPTRAVFLFSALEHEMSTQSCVHRQQVDSAC